VRVRTGGTLVERLLTDVVLVEQVIITLTQTLHSRRFPSWQLWLAVSLLLLAVSLLPGNCRLLDCA